MKENRKLDMLKQGSALFFMALLASGMELPVSEEIGHPYSEKYTIHQQQEHSPSFGLKYRLVGCTEKAQKMYEEALAKEPAITRDMIAIRNKLDIDFYGLGNTIKQADSVIVKIKRLAKADMLDGIYKEDYEYLATFGDLVRYTFMCEHSSLTEHTVAILEELKAMGYHIDEIDNKYLRKDIAYKAIHINATAPNAQKMEIQIHSPESMRLNVVTHKLYEKCRQADTPDEEKLILKERIKLAYSQLPLPAGIESIKNVVSA